MKPIISCVVPTRNRGNLIGETIKSIINQTMTEWELIVVDDHSEKDDKTEEVVRSFDNQRIHYYRLEDDNGLGISAARNFGNEVSSGQYIAVMDSDDIAYPDRFELSLKTLEREKCDLVYGDIDIWDPIDNSLAKREEEFSSRKFDLDQFKKDNFVPHVTVFAKRQLFLDFPYNSFFRIAEDYDFLSRLASFEYIFSYINKPLVKVRVHENKIMRSGSFKYEYGNIVKKNRGWTE